MSFATDVKDELLELPIKKTCCKKAFLLGVFLACRQGDGEGELKMYFYHQGTADLVSELLTKIFHAEPKLVALTRAGRRTFEICVKSAGISSFLETADGETEAHIAAGFRCSSCAQSFLRGAFLGSATVNDPKKGYMLEFLLPSEGRAKMLSALLEGTVGAPKRVKRGERIGLYYKHNAAISDILCLIGVSGMGFELANVSIERDIRNNENRATNCVASNISRSVAASRRQIAIIEELIRTRKIDALSDELRYTARLRVEYPSATLSELSMLHEPPISKSGLNRRLAKIMETDSETEEKQK